VSPADRVHLLYAERARETLAVTEDAYGSLHHILSENPAAAGEQIWDSADGAPRDYHFKNDYRRNAWPAPAANID